MRGMLGLVVGIVGVAGGCKDRPRESPASPAPAAPAAPAPSADAAGLEPLAGCGPGVARVCVDDAVMTCTGELVAECKAGCRAGACVNACEIEGVALAYLFTRDRRLLRFDPTRLPGDAAFTEVGKLDCDPRATPNAMAIDRQGVAWLNYHGGKLYTASIHTAHCTAINRMPDDAPSSFGMGFTTEGGGEALYVASMETPSVLGRIDTTTTPARYEARGTLGGGPNPEVTGTADGKLFGYFPAPGLGFVQEIDPATAAPVGPRWALRGTGRETVNAWTMAHWGGVFYVFALLGDTPTLHAIHREDGRYERLRMDLPFVAVGAGVSTCAPLLEQVAP